MIRKDIKSQSDFSSHFWYFPGSLEALLLADFLITKEWKEIHLLSKRLRERDVLQNRRG